MRTLLTLLLFITLQAAAMAHPTVSEVRVLYYKAATGKAATEQFSQVMQSMPKDAAPVLQAYKGMSLLLRAKYGINVYNKWTSFTRGKELIDAAVAKEPTNAEIHFLRFCAQTNAPSFLGYNGQIQADKQLLLSTWRTQPDADLRERIRSFLSASEYCSAEEKKKWL